MEEDKLKQRQKLFKSAFGEHALLHNYTYMKEPGLKDMVINTLFNALLSDSNETHSASTSMY